jgi:WD40-like Beta Propeller Repeat
MRLTAVLAILSGVAFSGARTPPRAPHYASIYALTPREGVFAYARISPDGKRLVYASRVNARDANGPPGYAESVVDLATKSVVFSESGIDAYWSPDGTRMIYSGNDGVTIRHSDTGALAGKVAPGGLGDYYSWAQRDGRDLILTIESHYYYLDGDKAVMPYGTVAACDGIGTGDRPLISKDGKRITTFVKGDVVVRGLDNCDNIFDTGIQGAKADFSWDGRYIAFHALKKDGTGYEIRIVDIDQRTVRTLPGLKGSALFPSWTQDGRLCFRYDGPDFRGFMMASGALDVPAAPLPTVPASLPATRTWHDIFPNVPAPGSGLHLVMIWAPWSAHSQMAFGDLERARTHFAVYAPDVSIAAAADPGAPESDITRQLAEFHVTLPRIPLSAAGLALTEARNQMPTTLLFRNNVLVDRRLGAQSFDQLRDWVETALDAGRKTP